MLIYLGALERYAPIAQLDRVTDYESVGRGFESLSAYQKTTQFRKVLGGFSLFYELLEECHFTTRRPCYKYVTNRNAEAYFCPEHLDWSQLLDFPKGTTYIKLSLLFNNQEG